MVRTLFTLLMLVWCGMTAAAKPWPLPHNSVPKDWIVVGPFPNEIASEKNQYRPGLDLDYLVDIGGESAARIKADMSVTFDGKQYTARKVIIGSDEIIDFQSLFGDSSSLKVAYAYTEWSEDRARTLQALFGSDDAPAVWLNGHLIHRLPILSRGINLSSDRFDLPLKAGVNRLLIKVENGEGGWGFGLMALDAQGLKAREALRVRRDLGALDPGPTSNRFLLNDDFPAIVWRNSEAGKQVFGDNPIHVRWFGPDLNELERPDKPGAYTAVIEAATVDGYSYRQMLTFAKVPAELLPLTNPRVNMPPFNELPAIRIPDLPGRAQITERQQAELSRHLWRAAGNYFRAGEGIAIAAAALIDISKDKDSQSPAILDNGFIRNAERQLKLRIKLEGRKPNPLPPPKQLANPAGELHFGSERKAGLRPGTVKKLRKLCKEWIKDDPNGFAVLVARRGVITMQEGFGDFNADTPFYPASLGKMIAGLTFARAVDEGLLGIDQKISEVLPDWNQAPTSKVTFRYLFNHMAGLRSHSSLNGMYNAYLDNGLFLQDGMFADPGQRYLYNGDDQNIAGKAMELVTGQTAWQMLYEQMQAPFEEPVSQFDFGYGGWFNVSYLAKVGQMMLQDGKYGRFQFYKPGLVQQLFPKRFAEFAPEAANKTFERGIGLAWMMDPPGARDKGVLGPNVVGHGSASNSVLRVAPDHELVVVIGRNRANDQNINNAWVTKFIKILADGILE